jgi:hypothetical protein
MHKRIVWNVFGYHSIGADAYVIPNADRSTNISSRGHAYVVADVRHTIVLASSTNDHVLRNREILSNNSGTNKDAAIVKNMKSRTYCCLCNYFNSPFPFHTPLHQDIWDVKKSLNKSGASIQPVTKTVDNDSLVSWVPEDRFKNPKEVSEFLEHLIAADIFL